MSVLVRKKKEFYLLEIILSILLIAYFLPNLIIINISLKSVQEAQITPFYKLPAHATFANFINVFKESNIGRALFNSGMFAFLSVIFIILFASMAAYPISRKKTIFAKYIFGCLMIGLLVPFPAIMIALMKLLNFYHIYGSYAGVIACFVSGLMPFSIYLYSSYIKSIPRELDESASIDGASDYRFFWVILFPLLKPVTATLVITAGLGVYNELMLPLIMLNSKNGTTVTTEILSFLGKFVAQWPLSFAGVIVAAIPIMTVFVIFQKHFIKGLTSGIVK